MGFRHAHFCTNDYPFVCVWVYVMHISVRMTIHLFLNGFLSCTPFYEWLSICLCMGLRHAHFCTNDYPYLYGFLSLTFLYKWLYIFFLNGFTSCTFLYEWLPFLSNSFLLNENSVQCSLTREYHGAVKNYKRYYNVYRFWVFEHKYFMLMIYKPICV